jgi:hypothetical protein
MPLNQQSGRQGIKSGCPTGLLQNGNKQIESLISWYFGRFWMIYAAA